VDIIEDVDLVQSLSLAGSQELGQHSRRAVGKGNLKTTTWDQGTPAALGQRIVALHAIDVPQFVGGVQIMDAAQRRLSEYRFAQVGEGTGTVDQYRRILEQGRQGIGLGSISDQPDGRLG
jgi:hypothetical protein